VLLNIRRWVCKKLISRVKFRDWLTLEDIRSQVKEAADQGENDKVSSLLCSYLSAALCHGNWGKLPWEDVLNEYAFAVNLHTPSRDFRIFSVDAKKKAFRINDSSWYSWSSVLAVAYGWDLKYIAELDIDDAISLIQEVLYDEQLQKEWEWTLSEKSVSYDERGEGKFNPLDRPQWMRERREEKVIDVPKVKIRADMIPPGIIIRWDEPNVKH